MLWLVGDGPDRMELERHAQALGITRCRFFGRIIDGVDKFFAAADFFVLPGIGGLAFNQAMFWGTPCIGSEADGTENDLVIDGRTGRRFVPGDRDSLKAALCDCAGMGAAQRRIWGNASRDLIIQRSNVSAMVGTFVGCIEDLLNRRQGDEKAPEANRISERHS